MRRQRARPPLPPGREASYSAGGRQRGRGGGENRRRSRLHQRPAARPSPIPGLCFLVMAVDGYDTVVVGYIAPALRAAWNLSPGQLAPLFGAGLIGLAVGSFVLGPLADLIGRRTVIILSVAAFGSLSLVSASASSLPMLPMTGTNILSAAFYPTASRATGVSW